MDIKKILGIGQHVAIHEDLKRSNFLLLCLRLKKCVFRMVFGNIN